jgi:hypothetical protein
MDISDSFPKDQEGGMLLPMIRIGSYGLVALGTERFVREEVGFELAF